MKKILSILAFYLIVINAFAFKPEKQHFKNEYLWNLYQEGISYLKLPKETKAILSSEKITCNYAQGESIILSRKNGTIFSVERKINLKIRNQKYLQRINFAFNTENSIFLKNLVSRNTLIFNIFSNEKAVDEIWKRRKNKTLKINKIVQVSNKTILFTNIGKIKLILISKNFDDQKYKLPEKIISNEETEIKPKKRKPSQKIKKAKKIKKFKKIKKVAKPQKKVSKLKNADDLFSFIEENYQTKVNKKILNNSINNPLKFIKKNYNKHRVTFKDDKFILNNGKFDNLSSCISLDLAKKNDIIYFYSNNEIKQKNTTLILTDNEKIDCSRIDPNEIEIIKPFINHLNNLHRSLNGDLIHFLLKPIGIKTIISNHNTNFKKIYEVDSYANILLLLNKFWKDHEIYSSIKKTNKVNNHIEIFSHLIAKKENSESYDFCKIRFHLNKEYRIDLIMISFHSVKK